MLAELIGSKNNHSNDWGENLLNTVATQTIRHLFTQSKSVDVQVCCHPSSKLWQGSIDSLRMSGSGLLIRREFPTEEIWFETEAISLDLSSLWQGKISLKQPTVAIAKVKLREENINKIFQAKLVKKRLENLHIPVLADLSEGQPVSFTDLEVKLLGKNEIKLFAKASLGHNLVPIALSCTLGIAKRRQIKFENIQFIAEDISSEFQQLSQHLTPILGDILNEMVDLERFNLEGVTIRLNRLETQGKTLVFSGYAEIEKIPSHG